MDAQQTAGENVWRAFQWANMLLMRRFRADLRAIGLSLEEFDVLVHIYPAPDHSLALTELAQSLVLADSMTRSGLTRLLDRMERAGLLTRRLNATDRRRFDVVLTPAGIRKFDEIWPDHLEGIQHYFSAPLADEDLTALRAALTKLIDANS